MSVDIVVEDELVEAGTVEIKDDVEVTSTIPEKFTGKSAEEIAESYVALEKELGRKNNEVGELRRLSDQYLQQELTRHDPKKEDTPLDFDALVEDPTKSIESVVNPQIEQITRKLAEQEQAIRLKDFQTQHPDYMDVGNSDEFQNWVQASPYRAKQLDAAQKFDFDAASDLLGTFKQQTGALREAAEQGKKNKRAKDLKDAGGETAGTGESTQKVWTRMELMELRKDPDRWDAMQPEIIKAYQENRVKT